MTIPEPTAESDYPICARCGHEYSLRDDHEPSKYCDACAHEVVEAAEKRAEEAERQRDELLKAITEHHSQKADDRCIEDDDKLYAVAGLPPCDRRVGDKGAMLANCKRFIENRCEGGGWPSYAELEADRDELAKRLATLTEAIRKSTKHLEEIVCTVEPDRGVVLLSSDAPTHYDAELKAQVYEHDNFSPLGDALISLHDTLIEAIHSNAEPDAKGG